MTGLLSLVKIYQSLLLLSGTMVSLVSLPVLSATYAAYPGSRIAIQSINQSFSGGGSGNLGIPATGSWSVPLLGAVLRSDASYNCVPANNIVRVDGATGIQVNNNKIIAGFTGSITGGVAHYQEGSNGNWIELTGGLLFAESGEASPTGSVSQNKATRLCATSDVIRGGDRVAGVANSDVGNKYATVNLNAWLYVPKTATPGTYTLMGVMLGQGVGTSAGNTAMIPVISSGATIEVLPPPCTISTQTNIVFDTTIEDGMKVSAPVTFQCGNVIMPTSAQAYLQVKPVGATLSDTELNMMNDGEAVGGVVRGYAGKNLELSQANCTNNAQSLSFSKLFGTPLGTVTTGNQQQLPLIWQLCRKGNEKAGKATASALLDITYQ